MSATVQRTLTVEPCPDGYMAMTERGEVSLHPDAEAVVRWVRQRDARRLRRTGAGSVTTIRWCRMPEGWEAPS